jgi:hypothetical protein
LCSNKLIKNDVYLNVNSEKPADWLADGATDENCRKEYSNFTMLDMCFFDKAIVGHPNYMQGSAQYLIGFL